MMTIRRKKLPVEEKQMKDVEYYIPEGKNVVVCKIWNCKYIAQDRIFKYTRDYEGINQEYEINDCYIGIAKCDPQDEFDEEFGKTLALTRAKAQRGRDINNAIYRYIKAKQKDINTLLTRAIHKVPNPREIYEDEE